MKKNRTTLLWEDQKGVESLDYFELLRQRGSTRKFQPTQISRDEVSALLFAANHAPVGSNRYEDVHLTVVQDRAILDQLSLAARQRFTAMAHRQEIFGSLKPGALPEALQGYDPFYGAPTVIFASHRRQTIQPGIEYCNVACLVSAMHLAAADLGLGSVFMWFALESMQQQPELDRRWLLALPENFEPLLGLAVGYPPENAAPKPNHAVSIATNYLL